MKRTRAKFRQVLIGKCILSLFIALGFAGTSFAAQFDAPYQVAEKKNKEKWSAKEKQISEKLAALEKKFGKKPNIIMVLSDDVGWGVLGSYGGGKVVGTPTPNLDKMARDGMKFLSAYSEPSCTPTRLALLTGRQPHRTGVNVVLWPGQKQGIVAEEEIVLRDVTHHAVRPMCHGYRYECNGLASQLYLGLLLGRGDGDIPIVFCDNLLTPLRGYDLSLGRLLPVEPDETS